MAMDHKDVAMTDIAEQGPAGKASAQAESAGERDYGRSIRAAARGFLTGVFDEFQFIDTMVTTVMRGLTRAFGEGLSKAGAIPADLDTPAYLPERLELDKIINQNQASLFDFSRYINTQIILYLDGQKQAALNHVFNRALLWSNQYDKARQTAYTMASGDALQLWIYGDTVEHCQSCSTFEGRIYRASTWAQHMAIPKSSRLCCTGLRCGCGLIPAPPGSRITPGRFPESALCY